MPVKNGQIVRGLSSMQYYQPQNYFWWWLITKCNTNTTKLVSLILQGAHFIPIGVPMFIQLINLHAVCHSDCKSKKTSSRLNVNSSCTFQSYCPIKVLSLAKTNVWKTNYEEKLSYCAPKKDLVHF